MKYPASKHMITGVAALFLVLISQGFALPDAGKEVLSQKILLENTIHQRVSDAVYRMLRHENFIVTVNVVMEATPSQKYTTIYERPVEQENIQAQVSGTSPSLGNSVTQGPSVMGSEVREVQGSAVQNESGKKTRTVLKKRPIKTNIPSEIPGFPGIQSPGFELYEEEVAIEEERSDNVVYAAEDELARMVAPEDTSTSEVAAEASLELNENEVILEEGLEPVARGVDEDQRLVEYTDPESPRLSRHTVASTTGPSLRVKKMELTIMLEDPESPIVIENIRKVAMVASHYNRERGDRLQVLTADFQGSKVDKPDTEQVLLKSIAESMTAIKARQKEEAENQRIKELEAEQDRMRQEQAAKEAQQAELARLRQEELKKQQEHEAELARIRQAEEERIRQREAELDEMREKEQARLAEERQQLFEAQQKQAQERLRQDSLRLALLTEQLGDLKNQLSAVDLEEEQRLKLELEQKRREAEQSAIRDREAELKKQLQNIEDQRLQANMLPEDDKNFLPMLIFGAAGLLLLAILVGALLGSRGRRPDVGPEHADLHDQPEPEVSVKEEQPVEAEKLPEPEIDAELVGEVDSIKKSVVSLAVSKPGSASSIVKEWLQDTGAEEEAAEEPAEDESNGKKKKKGSK